MSQAPVPTGTTDGFAPPIVTQFAVFLDNRVGKLRQLTQIFEDQHLTLCALSVVDAVSYAICRVVTSNAALARRLLIRHGLAFSEVDLLVVELSDDHTLTEICAFLTQVEVSIHYVYPLWVQPRRQPVMAMYCDDTTFAAQILRRRLVTLFGENELGDNATGNTPGTATPGTGTPAPGTPGSNALAPGCGDSAGNAEDAEGQPPQAQQPPKPPAKLPPKPSARPNDGPLPDSADVTDEAIEKLFDEVQKDLDARGRADEEADDAHREGLDDEDQNDTDGNDQPNKP